MSLPSSATLRPLRRRSKMVRGSLSLRHQALLRSRHTFERNERNVSLFNEPVTKWGQIVTRSWDWTAKSIGPDHPSSPVRLWSGPSWTYVMPGGTC